MAVSNPDWVEALRLHIEINQSEMDPQVRDAVELPWSWLSTKQEELFAEGEVIDADWDAVFPSIKDAVIRYVDGYWESKAAWDSWNADLADYKAKCIRAVPPEEVERARTECIGLQGELNSRSERIQQKDAATVAALERDAKAPVEANSSRIQNYLKKVEHWNQKVIEYNKAASQLLSNARKPDIIFIDRLVKKYRLDVCQRRVLHQEIRGQNYSDEEIEEIAREIGATGRGRCRRQGEGGQ
ncbi:hypothetical protein EPO15_13300 [bacterium]|nr:MAG: hypothetical protein EPO15_13300 [bacterium]